LALVDCRRVGEHQLIELAKAVSNFATIEVDAEFAFLQIDANTTLLIVVLVVVIVFEAIAGRCELSELIGMSRATLAELEERRVPESDGIRLTGAAENGKACHFTQSGGASSRRVI
jgi:hypothetical protein